jgi:hypothetical protein
VLVGIDYPWRPAVFCAQSFGSETAQPPLHRVWPDSKLSIVAPQAYQPNLQHFLPNRESSIPLQEFH